MILVCGEILVDIFIRDEQGDKMLLEAFPGGSPFNVAVGLARLQQPSAFFTGLSHDLIGKRLERFLNKEGVDSRFLKRSQRLSTLSLVDESGPTPAYAFFGEGAADRDLSEADLPNLDDEVKAIHFASYSTIVEPVGSSLLHFARREADRRLISYDPNLRLSVSPNLALWQQRVEAFAACAGLIKMSDEDFAQLYGAQDLQAISERWLKGRTRIFVLTRGSKGASAFTRQGRIDIVAPKIEVVDTVGAGDSFAAALLAVLNEYGHLSLHGLDKLPQSLLERYMVFAASAAALTCSRSGADLPRRGELTDWPLERDDVKRNHSTSESPSKTMT